jgi:hypothetical protein
MNWLNFAFVNIPQAISLMKGANALNILYFLWVYLLGKFFKIND